MKKRIFKIIILIIIVGLAIGLNGGLRLASKNSTVQAIGDLVVDWGVPSGNPIFTVNNMTPGQQETRSVVINNSSSFNRGIGVRGLKDNQTKNFSQVLNIEITEGSNKIYGPVKLAQFFTESSGPIGIPLFLLSSGSTKTINFIVTFDKDSNNDYQEASIIFDLIIGLNYEVPAECKGIDFSKGQVIFGTEDNDNIHGTNGNDLIFGLEGNDKIDGSNGDDCLVGGVGKDNINGSNGNDVILGNEGDDILDGSNGKDIIYGGQGNDQINGGNGTETDTIYGEEGNDIIHGSNGKDLIYGGDGNDIIYGGNGDDNIEGGTGNDKLYGGNGADVLIGGLGNDSADGGLGKDKCIASKKTSCEL